MEDQGSHFELKTCVQPVQLQRAFSVWKNQLIAKISTYFLTSSIVLLPIIVWNHTSNCTMHYVYLHFTSPFRSLKLRTLLCALNLIPLDLLPLKLLVGMLLKKLEKGIGFLLIQLWVFLVSTCEWLLGMYGIGNYSLVLVSGQGLRLRFVRGLRLSCFYVYFLLWQALSDSRPTDWWDHYSCKRINRFTIHESFVWIMTSVLLLLVSGLLSHSLQGFHWFSAKSWLWVHLVLQCQLGQF